MNKNLIFTLFFTACRGCREVGGTRRVLEMLPTHRSFTPRKQRWHRWRLECCRVQSACCCWGKSWGFFFGCTKLFGLPKRCTVAELLHIAYDGDNDLLHIGIILLCEVLAPSLLNMHECLKWILEDFFSPPTTTTTSTNTSSSSLSNYIIIFLSIKIRMNNLNVWQQPGAEKRKVFCSAAGRQGCVWWAMHAKLTLLWWEKKKKKGEAKQ